MGGEGIKKRLFLLYLFEFNYSVFLEWWGDNLSINLMNVYLDYKNNIDNFVLEYIK